MDHEMPQGTPPQPTRPDSVAQASEGHRPAPAPTKKPRSKSRKNRKKTYSGSLKAIRRLHLYFGLALVPFVLLYGVTAILFNHQTWFSSSTITATSPELLQGLKIPSAGSIADEVIEEMSADMDVPVEHVAGTAPEFSGSFIVDFRDDDARRRYRIAPDSMASTLQETPTTPTPESPSPFPSSIEPRLTATMDELVERLEAEHEGTDGTLRSTPDVEFRVMADEKDWTVTYDPKSGELSERLTSEPTRPFNLRSFLLRLHVSHGYPSEAGTRTLWAIIVDITAGLMIFWALSGVVMWWQIRPTRRSGFLTMIIGLGLAGLLGYGMLNLLYY